MSTGLSLLIVVLTLVLLLAGRAPVGFALLVSGVLGIWLTTSTSVTLSHLASVPYSAIANYGYLIVPMFIVMGMFALQAGLARDLYGGFAKHTKRIPGSLGVATIAACAGFAAITGSSLATVATLGRLCIGEMEKYGYPRHVAAGIVGAAGTLGVLIPPSIILVMFGIATGESIGQLLLAGILPGLLSAVLYIAGIVLYASRRGLGSTGPQLGSDTEVRPERPLEAGTSPRAAVATEAAKSEDLEGRLAVSVFFVALIVLAVVGGLYSGLFTATESGAIGAVVTLVLLILRRARSGRVIVSQGLRDAFREATDLSAMAFLILVGASLFSLFLVAARVPQTLTSTLADSAVPAWLVAALFFAMLIPLGMFLDPISVTLIAAPILYAPLTALGFDGVWLGIMFVKLVELGLITPPVGLNAYVVAGTVPDLPVESVFRGLIPFYFLDLLAILLLFLFPAIALAIPSRMG